MQAIKLPVTIDKLDRMIALWERGQPEHVAMELQLAKLLRSTMVLAGIESSAELERWAELVAELREKGSQVMSVRNLPMEANITIKTPEQEHDAAPHGIFSHLFNPDGSLPDAQPPRRFRA